MESYRQMAANRGDLAWSVVPGGWLMAGTTKGTTLHLSKYFDPKVLDILTYTLPTHPLWSLKLRLSQRPGFGWCSLPAEVIADADRARLLEAVGDPFEFDEPSPPSHSGDQSATVISYGPMWTIILFTEFSPSHLWKGHFCEPSGSS